MSIRTRTSLLLAAAVMLTVVICGCFSLAVLERELRQLVYEGANVTATAAANGIATYLDDTLHDTHAAAVLIAPAALADRDIPRLEQQLRQLVEIYPKFENGAWLLAADGTMLADYPVHRDVRGQSFAHRDYYRRTVAEQRGVIGKPYVSVRSQEPVLTFTTPIVADDGRLAGILACSTKLASPLALGGLVTLQFGDSGYLYIVDRQRTLLVHPERERILEEIAPGANPLLDATLRGAAGTGETVNSRGVGMLVAFQPVPGTDWLVAAQQPVSEALRPVVIGRRWLFGGMLLAGALALPLGMLALRRVTRNLRGLQATLDELVAGAPLAEDSALTRTERLTRLEGIPPHTELGNIAASFRTLYGQLEQNVATLQRATAEWEQTFDAVPLGIVILDRDNRPININRAAASMLELDRDQVLGACCRGFLHREGCSPESCPSAQIVRSGQGMRGELSFRGTDQVAEVITTPLIGSDGAVLGTVNLLHDLKSQYHAEKRIEQLEQFDPISELPNRDKFRILLQELLKFPNSAPHQVGVLLLDLDNFATLNDSLGHAAGDELIRAVAQRLKSILGPGYPVARLGGDEFAVLIPILSGTEDATQLCQLLLQAFVNPFQVAGQTVFSTISVGIALYPEHGLDPGSLLKNADIAMYHAKEHGRNTYQVYRRDMDSNALERLRLGTNLRHALDRHEFTLHYQPCIDLESREVVGVEALLRWHNLEFGDVSPERFIPLAEANGLINAIGDWVLRTACDQGRAWLDAGLPPLRIAVNLSGVQLKHDDLAARVRQHLDESGFPAQSLELELTETVLMENPEAAAELLERFKALGIHIALDDFGTGYSSLNYLKRFPLDRLKIDRSFVRDMVGRADDASIVEVIITIAHTLGLQVTAEGIETSEQLEFLRDSGCQHGQGFLFSPPLPAGKIPAFLAANHNEFAISESA